MVEALFPIGKTQWAKWGDAAREAYNRSRVAGFTHETGVAEANAVQAKARNPVRVTVDELLADEEAPTPPAAAPAPKRAPRTKKGK